MKRKAAFGLKDEQGSAGLHDPEHFFQAGFRILPEIKGFRSQDEVKFLFIERKHIGGAFVHRAAALPDGLFVLAVGKVHGPEGRINARHMTFRRFLQKTLQVFPAAAADFKDFRILRYGYLGQPPERKGRIPEIRCRQQVSLGFRTGVEGKRFFE